MPDQIELTLVLRQPDAAKALAEGLLAGTFDSSKPDESKTAATPADIKAVTNFVTTHNLTLLSTDAAARAVKVSGSVADIQKAFNIPSGDAGDGSVENRNYKGPINLPAPLDHLVIAVLGLDQTPIARRHAQ